jgi:putative membrane protein
VNALHFAIHGLDRGNSFGYCGWGFGWPWPGVIWLVVALLFWAGLIALLVWAVRSSSGPRRDSDSAMETLRQRLARGEISQEEYEHIRQLLWG